MRVQYLDLADFLAVACEVTGLDLDTVTAVANLDMADSALHAPMEGGCSAPPKSGRASPDRQKGTASRAMHTWVTGPNPLHAGASVRHIRSLHERTYASKGDCSTAS